ncbi:MAG: hypothetical protein LBU69_00790 [Deltaproteobacteria bacterium]|nr:hypothetical protein [Deltaproteobacteria bacterium]
MEWPQSPLEEELGVAKSQTVLPLGHKAAVLVAEAFLVALVVAQSQPGIPLGHKAAVLVAEALLVALVVAQSQPGAPLGRMGVSLIEGGRLEAAQSRPGSSSSCTCHGMTWEVVVAGQGGWPSNCQGPTGHHPLILGPLGQRGAKSRCCLAWSRSGKASYERR